MLIIVNYPDIDLSQNSDDVRDVIIKLINYIIY